MTTVHSSRPPEDLELLSLRPGLCFHSFLAQNPTSCKSACLSLIVLVRVCMLGGFLSCLLLVFVHWGGWQPGSSLVSERARGSSQSAAPASDGFLGCRGMPDQLGLEVLPGCSAKLTGLFLLGAAASYLRLGPNSNRTGTILLQPWPRANCQYESFYVTV